MSGRIVKVSGLLVMTTGLEDANMADVVQVDEQRLIGEILNVNDDAAFIQVYEKTSGLGPGAVMETAGASMSVELSSDTIENIYDGIQRPLEGIIRKTGNNNLPRGVEIPALSQEKKWDSTAVARPGGRVTGGDVLGTVQETSVVLHKIMVPLTLSGTIESIQSGSLTVLDTVAVLAGGEGEKHALTMTQKWPVRVGRPHKHKYPPRTPLLSDQRIVDAMFPMAKGGTVIIPGPFGSGRTVMQHQLAKWLDVNIIVYIDCGERGSEMTDVLREFPELVDPRIDESLMKRTILITNTSDIPVTTREASICTGVTIAEYLRDMGYDAAVIADSTSRWTKALREMSDRLEEMPGEEGYPAYLSSRLAQFYKQAGTVGCIGSDEHRRGSLTTVGAVLSPDGDLSKPVSQATIRIVRVFWAPDASLAYRRHSPAINWLNSYSLYLNSLKPWYDEHLGPQFTVNRDGAMSILQEEASLNGIVRLVGKDSLSAVDQLTLETAKMLREDFLQQDSFMEVDWYSSCERRDKMIQMILDYGKLCHAVIERGATTAELFAIPFWEQIGRARSVPDDWHAAVYADMAREMEEQITDIVA